MYDVELTYWNDKEEKLRASLVDYTHKRVDNEDPVLYLCVDGVGHFIKWDTLKSFSIIKRKTP